MRASPLTRRALAVGLLLGLAFVTGTVAVDWMQSYADGQGDIVEKRAELQNLQDLVRARTEFARLRSKTAKTPLIGPGGDDAQASLSTTIARVAERQQVVIDGIEPVASDDPARVLAAVHLRGTQSGLHAFLRAVEDQTPYLLVQRLDVGLERSADLDRGKPLVLRSDLRVAALVAPATPPKAPPDEAPP